jgi:hypothetical protein
MLGEADDAHLLLRQLEWGRPEFERRVKDV